MCKEWESRLVYVKLTLLHLRNSNSGLHRITEMLKLEKNLQIKLLETLFLIDNNRGFEKLGDLLNGT